jgi:hypothetical protein
MTVLKNCGALNAEMFVGVCLTGGALLLGIAGAQFFNSRKAEEKIEVMIEGLINLPVSILSDIISVLYYRCNRNFPDEQLPSR